MSAQSHKAPGVAPAPAAPAPAPAAPVPAEPASTRPARGMRIAAAVAALCGAAAVGYAAWRYLPALIAWLMDAQAVRAFVDEWGAMSRIVLVSINVAQVVIAFLPGEPVELASGYAFGFWEGTALCLLASAIATTAVYWAVRRWGWRVVGLFFDRSMLDRFAWLRDARRLELIMFVIFLIPGTPKDFLTYFAGLTRARFLPVLVIATVGRIPSIVTSTIMASSFGAGDYTVTMIALAAAVVLAAFGAVAYRRVAVRAAHRS